ncbi:MAG: hypothetical protein IPK53_19685 [bacterium]|nr:hypothetical protein [bacterium]
MLAWADGPYSQAVRAQTRGDVEKVRVAIKPDGATYSNYFYVLTGLMDTAQAFSDPVAIINVMGEHHTRPDLRTVRVWARHSPGQLPRVIAATVVGTDADRLGIGLVLNGLRRR